MASISQSNDFTDSTGDTAHLQPVAIAVAATSTSPPNTRLQDVQQSQGHSSQQNLGTPISSKTNTKAPAYQDRKEFGLPIITITEHELSLIRPFYGFIPRKVFGKHPNEPKQPVRITDRELMNLNLVRWANDKDTIEITASKETQEAMPGASRHYETVIAGKIAKKADLPYDSVLATIKEYELEVEMEMEVDEEEEKDEERDKE